MATTAGCPHSGRTSTCPPWLQAALAEIEQRVQEVALHQADSSSAESDSFADRAEYYYQKRPQLIALVQDLHNRYLLLADRYSQSLAKPHHVRQISAAASSIDDDDSFSSAASDAESSLSFQLPPVGSQPGSAPALDLVISELVLASIERNILLDGALDADRRRSESDRKIDLQRSLLEVLESERMVLLGENARLGFRAAAAEEERRGMARELGFLRSKAAEMARVAVKVREDHRVCILGRRIEGLQAQIYGLERMNREWGEAMKRREASGFSDRVEMQRLREENRRLREKAGKKGWWGRVWKTEFGGLCGPPGKGGNAGCGCFYL